MTNETENIAELTFPPDPASVAAARRFAVAAVDDLDSPTESALVLLVSELATNAILHARTPFTVRVMANDGTIRVEVVDGNPRLPRRKRFGPGAVTGRGLLIVDKEARRWSAERVGGGKKVWFELAGESA